MTFDEFIIMLQAMQDEKPFKVGHHLQYNSEGGFYTKGTENTGFPRIYEENKGCRSPGL